jgi:hypothetical protein
MPNWCENRLEVSGDTTELKKFLEMGIIEKEGKSTWVMSNYYPTPEPLKRTVSPARDCEWVNEWEVRNAKQRIKNQPELIAKLNAELVMVNGEERVDLLDQIKQASKPIEIPELIPCANGTEKDRKALIEQYGFDNWYDWNHANWGTKWDCTSEDLGYDTDNATYFNVGFNSAWSPPMGWFDKVVGMFPNLKFKLTYMETGCWFAGVAFGFEGEVNEEEGEPENQDDEGVVYTYKNGVYVGENGNEIDEDEWYDNEDYATINPFETVSAPWE